MDDPAGPRRVLHLIAGHRIRFTLSEPEAAEYDDLSPARCRVYAGYRHMGWSHERAYFKATWRGFTDPAWRKKR